MIVIDTNVLSELLRPKPEPSVRRWIEAHPSMTVFTTTITEAEVRYGIALLPVGRRRSALAQAVEEIFDAAFADRILAFDSSAARAFAGIVANRRLRGHPISQFDAMIASIAASHRAGVATRNVADFADCGIDVFNPWQS